ncbi:MAG: tetratricopeptide repeat protein [Fervidobacterium sp.]
MKFEKILLTITSVFGLLFLITYLSFINVSNQLERAKKVIKAYELYTTESKEFPGFISKNNLKELEPLVSKKLLTDIRSKLDRAMISYREGNYSDAAALLRAIKDTDNPWMDEIYFYLGMSLYKAGEFESAKLFLSSFINKFQYSVYRKEALHILREISSDDVRKQIDNILNNLDKR